MEVAPHLADGFDGFDDFICRFAVAMYHDRHAGGREGVHAGAVAFRELRGTFLDIEDEHAETAFFRDGSVKLAKGAGGEVSRIRGGLLPQFFLEFVVAFEVFMGHVDFAAQRQAVIGQVERQRDVRDDARVGRDIFADEAVAAGLRKDEAHGAVAVSPVRDGHGEAVHLDFHRERGVRMDRVDLVDKGADRVELENVFDGQHRDSMRHLDAGLPLDGPAHFLGRRVRVDPLRVLLLGGFQLLHELIVLEVRDLRRILVIVPVHMIFDGIAKCLIFQLSQNSISFKEKRSVKKHFRYFTTLFSNHKTY